MVRPVAALLAALLAGPAPGVIVAHPLHTSFTEIVRDRTGAISLSVRLFADDFRTTLDSLAALPSSRGVSDEVVARRYFEGSVSLIGGDGKPVALAWCGMRTDENLTWICARSTGPLPSGTLHLRNALMFDRFADQISIIRWTVRSKARTLVLTGSAPQARLE